LEEITAYPTPLQDANGVDIQIITKSTGLSIEQLQDLQSKMKDQ